MEIHIQRDGVILCGSLNAKEAEYPTSRENVIETAPNQHAGWYWCTNCVSILTGKNASWFTDQRK